MLKAVNDFWNWMTEPWRFLAIQRAVAFAKSKGFHPHCRVVRMVHSYSFTRPENQSDMLRLVMEDKSQIHLYFPAHERNF